MASITVVSGPNAGDYYPLGKRTWVFGRGENVPAQIVDDKVSRKHLQVRPYADRDAYVAMDMNSSNGTMINGRRLEPGSDIELMNEDEIEIGSSKLIFSTTVFADRESALNHFKRRGERGQPTIVQR